MRCSSTVCVVNEQMVQFVAGVSLELVVVGSGWDSD